MLLQKAVVLKQIPFCRFCFLSVIYIHHFLLEILAHSLFISLSVCLLPGIGQSPFFPSSDYIWPLEDGIQKKKCSFRIDTIQRWKIKSLISQLNNIQNDNF